MFWIGFLTGFIVGGFMGVMAMCLIAVSPREDD